MSQLYENYKAMKRFLLLLLVCIPSIIYSQTGTFYQFKKETGHYAELTADTPVLPAKFGVGELSAFELNGETFSVFGKNYIMDGISTVFMFSSNGYIRIDDDTTFVIMDGLLHFLDSIDGNSKLSYKIEGAGNDKVFKIQWKNLKIRDGAADNFVNFQIWYYKATGIMETHYGPSSASNKSGYTSSTGPNVGLFYSPKDFSKMYEKIWITKSPEKFVIDSNRTVVFNVMFGVPENGAVYRYVPKQLATSLADVKDYGYRLCPNPANQEISMILNIPTTEHAQLMITDIMGKIVYRAGYEKGTKNMTIPVRSLADGNYYLTVSAASFLIEEQISIQH